MNLLNGKIYIGVHKTKDLDDGYMGSGKLLTDSIKKYGKENFRKDILEYFEDRDSMFSRETEYVTEEFILKEDNYNLKVGGCGGQTDPEISRRGGLKGGSAVFERKIGVFSEEGCVNLKKYLISEKSLNKLKENRDKIANSEQIREKIKSKYRETKHSQKENNSQFGTMWITNGLENKKLKKEDIIPEGWEEGRVYLKKQEIVSE